MEADRRVGILGTARAAASLYFKPLTGLAEILGVSRSHIADEVSEPRGFGRRSSDLLAFNFATAAGLISVGMLVCVIVTMSQLAGAKRVLQSAAINYFIDIQATEVSASAGLRLAGRVTRQDRALASVFGAPTDFSAALGQSGLELVPVIRSTRAGAPWQAERAIRVNEDGTFGIHVGTCEPATDCQVAILLVPAGTVRAGEHSTSVPRAVSASQIVAVERRKQRRPNY